MIAYNYKVSGLQIKLQLGSGVGGEPRYTPSTPSSNSAKAN